MKAEDFKIGKKYQYRDCKPCTCIGFKTNGWPVLEIHNGEILIPQRIEDYHEVKESIKLKRYAIISPDGKMEIWHDKKTVEKYYAGRHKAIKEIEIEITEGEGLLQ